MWVISHRSKARAKMASALVYSQAKSFGGGQQPSEKGSRSLKKLRAKTWVGSAVAIGILGGGLFLASHLFARTEVEAVAPLPSAVTISAPIEEPIEPRLQFLGTVAAPSHKSASRMVMSYTTATCYSQSTRVSTKFDWLRRTRNLRRRRRIWL